MVLAEAEDLDVTNEDELLVVGLERRLQHLRRIHPQPGEELGVRTSHPSRRPDQTLAVGILTEGDQNLAYGLLDARQIDGLLDG
jgi:hypothetical protein